MRLARKPFARRNAHGQEAPEARGAARVLLGRGAAGRLHAPLREGARQGQPPLQDQVLRKLQGADPRAAGPRAQPERRAGRRPCQQPLGRHLDPVGAHVRRLPLPGRQQHQRLPAAAARRLRGAASRRRRRVAQGAHEPAGGRRLRAPLRVQGHGRAGAAPAQRALQAGVAPAAALALALAHDRRL
ncbi:MAG: hypothetical protein CL844_03715 [Crocinitomicaceae bacterium]|nr:hypothetical protein [Crocinitomicaceae bacterium]